MKWILIEQDPMPGVEGTLYHLVSLVLTSAIDEMVWQSFVPNQVGFVKRANDDILGVWTRVDVDVVDIGHTKVIYISPTAIDGA